MKKLFFSAIFALSFFSLNSAYGETTSSQTVTATLNPFVTVSNIGSSLTSTQIMQGGKLLTDLTPSFKFSSNNKNGATATFNIKVNTADNGQINAISGKDNIGKIVLVNTNFRPNASAVLDALSGNPTLANNPNAISYQVRFEISNKNIGNVPVFDREGNTASGNILTRNGSNTVTLVISRDSVVKNSFSSDDESGAYQATIYCTSVDL